MPNAKYERFKFYGSMTELVNNSFSYDQAHAMCLALNALLQHEVFKDHHFDEYESNLIVAGLTAQQAKGMRDLTQRVLVEGR